MSRHRSREVRTKHSKAVVLLGAGAAVTAAALTLWLGDTTAHTVAPRSGGAGATSTQNTPPPTPNVPAAKPTLKSPGFSGGWQGSGPFHGGGWPGP